MRAPVSLQSSAARRASREFGIVGEVQLRQPHLARLAIEQAQRQRPQQLGREVQVQEGLLGAHHPVHLVAGGHQAQLARAAALRRRVLAVGAVAAVQVQRQRVVARQVARGIEAVRPVGHAQAVAQRRTPVQAGARVRQDVEHVGGWRGRGEGGHGVFRKL